MTNAERFTLNLLAYSLVIGVMFFLMIGIG